uniref:Uncharacterized protein n=1 Tax=Sclerotinia borealis TaxID=77105 RepID=A0A088CQW4_9HELO|nr:hypothetical protein SBORM_0122 [Sclerotinia borealis]AIJ56814.1 hypothetical protein SBORM_0122 [Sclerotinia borealis]
MTCIFMYKDIYTWKPLYWDLPVNSAKSYLFSGVDIGRSSSTPLTFNNSSNLESVTNKFWFNNILWIINEVVGFPLLICSNAKDSGLFAKGLMELKDLLLLCGAKEPIKYLVKDIAAIEPNPIRLSNINGLL